MNNTSEDNSAPLPAFSLDDRPVKILIAYQLPKSHGDVCWGACAESAAGGRKYVELNLSSCGSVFITGGIHYDECGLGRTELLLKKQTCSGEDERRPRPCDFLLEFAEELEFAPEVLLHWALLDLNSKVLAQAIAAGANLRGGLIEDMLPIDLAAASVAFTAGEILRFFQNDERESAWGPHFARKCDPDFAARAVEIRRMLIEAGAIDATPFRQALREGNFDEAYAELLAGLPLEALSPKGFSPLIEAILRKDLLAVRWLLGRGANRHTTGSYHSSLVPPMEASLVEHLRGPASDLERPQRRISPLTAACMVGFREGFQEMLTEGTDRPTTDDFNELINDCVPPDWALRGMAGAGFDFHKECSIEDRTLYGGESPLYIAISAGHIEMEKVLLEFGADPEALDDLGRKPEEMRKLRGGGSPTDCAEFLKDLGCDSNPRDWAEKKEPALLARTKKDPSALLELMTKWLNEPGADPRTCQLLLRAANANSPALVELLLRSHCDPQEMGFALLAAMDKAGQLTDHVWDHLVCTGSITDIGPSDGYRKTAAAICTLLRNAGAPDFTSLLAAARSGDLDGIRKEIAGGTPVNFTVNGWGSPLLAAIAGKQADAACALLEAGADPNLPFCTNSDPDRDEVFPVKAALESGDLTILAAVLQAGADLERGGVARAALFSCQIPSPEVASMVFGGHDVFSRWRNTMGNTGVHQLNTEGFDSCKHLIPLESLDERNYRAETPVLLALLNDNLKKAFTLIEAGADPACYGGLSREGFYSVDAYQAMPSDLGIACLNPMHTAILSGNILYVERMLQAGGKFDLPAFAAPTVPSPDILERLRRDLIVFEPAALRHDPTWRTWMNEDSLMFIIPNATRVVGLTDGESLLLQHFLSEEPGRAARYREFIIPLSCLDLAETIGSAVVREMVMAGSALEGRAFFQALREDIASLAGRFREALTLPDEEKPRPHPCIRSMRWIESALILKIWERTGELSSHAAKDSAMECLRYAGAEFDGGFITAIEKIETTGELSMDEFIGSLAESLSPGSTVDLGKFFQTALATLERFDQICASQW